MMSNLFNKNSDPIASAVLPPEEPDLSWWFWLIMGAGTGMAFALNFMICLAYLYYVRKYRVLIRAHHRTSLALVFLMFPVCLIFIVMPAAMSSTPTTPAPVERDVVPWWVWFFLAVTLAFWLHELYHTWRNYAWLCPGLGEVVVTILLLPLCFADPLQHAETCSPCIVSATQGKQVVQTLLFYTQQPSECKPSDITCLNQGTLYPMCQGTDGKFLCYQPEVPLRFKITIWAGLPKTTDPLRTRPAGDGKLFYLNSTIIIQQGTEPASLWIPACHALAQGKGSHCGTYAWHQSYKSAHKYLCFPHGGWQDGNPEAWNPCGRTAKCSRWSCVCAYTGGGFPGCPHILHFDWVRDNYVKIEVARSHPAIQVYGFGINGLGRDPKTYLTITREEVQSGRKKNHTWSVDTALEKLQRNPLQQISVATKNLFIDMAQKIATSLGINDCYVCGGTNMGSSWPWEAMEVSPALYNSLSRQGNITTSGLTRHLIWAVTSKLVGNICFSKTGSIPVGYLTCLGSWDNGTWVSPSNASEPEKFNATVLPYIHFNTTLPWKAPTNMYWICGNSAYEFLPVDWSGSCVLGYIKPSFFLIPIRTQQFLAAPVYARVSRKRREETPFAGFECKSPGDYKGNAWDTQRIVCVYGPATWAKDGSYGYRTPIYMLNRLIRLQAVLDLAGQCITKALTTLADATDQLRTAVYQNRLGLDYLLATENGLCGKFNLTNCCLKIDPVGKVVAQLTTEIKQLTFNPVQKWDGLQWDWLHSFLPQGWMKGLFTMLIGPICLLILFCLLAPCLFWFFKNSVQKIVDQVSSPKIIALMQAYEGAQIYRRVPLDDSVPECP